MKLHFHHVGMLVKDIPEAAHTFEKMGYLRETGIIHDPVQTAHVQFFKLPGETPYLELVAPDHEDSKLSNALRKGGGLNHVCYSTPDIDGTCAELSASGWHLIAEPTGGVAFGGRRIAWLRGPDRMLVELVEAGADGEL
jgi:methylmalonyl-CoA/ethylmalonyl-CoA epimerase